jgi:DNA-binding CsgD family transcriptional regulator
MIASWEGRFDEAHRLAAMWPELAFDFDRVHASAMRALYALGVGHREQAQHHIAVALALVEDTQYPYLFARRRAEIDRILCAIVEALLGRVTNANRIMQRKAIAEGPAIEAMKDVFVSVCRMAKNRTFTDDAYEALQQLKAIGYGGLAKTLERLLEKLATPETQVETPLTRAEIEVLQELGNGRSPKEIATATGRSVYTIQAHIQNIIKKLGCSGRHEAMSVARKRGFLG